MTERPACVDCGAQNAPHLGEQRTSRFADGVVRDERVRRCTPCQVSRNRYSPEQLDAQLDPLCRWGIRDHLHGTLLVDQHGTLVLRDSREQALAAIAREYAIARPPRTT